MPERTSLARCNPSIGQRTISVDDSPSSSSSKRSSAATTPRGVTASARAIPLDPSMDEVNASAPCFTVYSASVASPGDDAFGCSSVDANRDETTTRSAYPSADADVANASATSSGGGFLVPGGGGKCAAHTRCTFPLEITVAPVSVSCSAALTALVTSHTCTKPSAVIVVVKSFLPTRVDCADTPATSRPFPPFMVLHTRLSVDPCNSQIISSVFACTTTLASAAQSTAADDPHAPNRDTPRTQLGARATLTSLSTSIASKSSTSLTHTLTTCAPSAVARTNVALPSRPRAHAHDGANADGAVTLAKHPLELSSTHTSGADAPSIVHATTVAVEDDDDDAPPPKTPSRPAVARAARADPSRLRNLFDALQSSAFDVTRPSASTTNVRGLPPVRSTRANGVSARPNASRARVMARGSFGRSVGRLERTRASTPNERDARARRRLERFFARPNASRGATPGRVASHSAAFARVWKWKSNVGTPPPVVRAALSRCVATRRDARRPPRARSVSSSRSDARARRRGASPRSRARSPSRDAATERRVAASRRTIRGGSARPS